MKQSVTIIKKPHQVGSFTFDSTYFEQHTAQLEITEQPIELGAKVQDHAFVTPISLTISGGVSDTPLQPNPSFDSSANSARSSDAYQQLLTTMNARQFITVQTGLANYNNMLIKSINTVQDAKTANIFNFVMTIQQILVISTQNVNVPTQFLQTGKVADLAAPTKTNGTQLPKTPTAIQSSIFNRGINYIQTGKAS